MNESLCCWGDDNIQSSKVYYEGAYLPNINVTTNETLFSILQKLDALFGQNLILPGNNIVVSRLGNVYTISTTIPNITQEDIDRWNDSILYWGGTTDKFTPYRLFSLPSTLIDRWGFYVVFNPDNETFNINLRDNADTKWLNLSSSVDATETQKGVIRIGTQTEVDNGTLDTVAVTPLKLKNVLTDYITTETDPTVPSYVKAITTSQITEWDKTKVYSTESSFVWNTPSATPDNYNTYFFYGKINARTDGYWYQRNVLENAGMSVAGYNDLMRQGVVFSAKDELGLGSYQFKVDELGQFFARGGYSDPNWNRFWSSADYSMMDVNNLLNYTPERLKYRYIRITLYDNGILSTHRINKSLIWVNGDTFIGTPLVTANKTPLPFDDTDLSLLPNPTTPSSFSFTDGSDTIIDIDLTSLISFDSIEVISGLDSQPLKIEISKDGSLYHDLNGVVNVIDERFSLGYFAQKLAYNSNVDTSAKCIGLSSDYEIVQATNEAGQIKVNYTGLTLNNFTAETIKVFDVIAASATTVAPPTTTMPYSTSITFSSFFDAGRGSSPTGRFIENPRDGQVHTWRFQLSYTNKASGNNGSLDLIFTNPVSGFQFVMPFTLPSGRTSGTLNNVAITIADPASIPSPNGYILQAITSFSDTNLTIEINSITRISHALDF